jgi:hypothetical protein
MARRTWVRRVGLVLVLAIGGAGVWAALNATTLKVRYAAHRFTSAATDDDRAKWADQLAGHGDAGLPRLVEFVKAGDATLCPAAAAAIERHLAALPDGDPRAVAVGGQLLDAFPGGDTTPAAVLDLLPAVLKRTGPVHAVKCRQVVAAGLKLPSPDARLVAVRLAIHPQLKLRADLVPLLAAPEAEVRRAALFAVGPATDDDPVLGDEDLFRWLHDPDPGVRRVCLDSLTSRGRNEAEISLGRRLTSPDVRERLELLRDLRYDDDVPDAEPWLERLSRDADPAVRAGAARVAVEVAAEKRLPVPVWIGRLAEADPDATVRRIARQWRDRPAAAGDEGLRLIGGP